MSRILDSMKTRIAKLEAKIKPLAEEKDSLIQAVSILEKQEEVTPTDPSSPKSETPHFLGKKTNG